MCESGFVGTRCRDTLRWNLVHRFVEFDVEAPGLEKFGVSRLVLGDRQAVMVK